MEPVLWSQHFERTMHEFFAQGFQGPQDVATFIKKKHVTELGGFGGATTCVEVVDGDRSLLIDGGSGLKKYNDYLEQKKVLESTQASLEFHILISHFHFDHLLGLPFFTPHFLKNSRIHYYSVQDDTALRIKQMFQRPTFPVGFEQLQAQIIFHALKPYEKNQINGFEVTAYRMDHPDESYGFRIEKNKKVYAHAVDHEAVRLTATELGPDAGLFEKANLLYFDAQYTENEMLVKKGWGHGTCDRGFKVARDFAVEQILFAHHDPSLSLQDSWNQKKKAEQFFQAQVTAGLINSSLKWDFAYEGQQVDLCG
jgi:phosphoribosyl 1,2-cyclic phosphodiesterase